MALCQLESAGNIWPGTQKCSFLGNLDPNTYRSAPLLRDLENTNCGQTGRQVWMCVNATFPLLEAAVNNSFLSEVWSPSYSVACVSFFFSFHFFFFFLIVSDSPGGHLLSCTVHHTRAARCIILSVQFNVEQIRLRLTELVLHDGSLYPHRKQTAPASRAFITSCTSCE